MPSVTSDRRRLAALRLRAQRIERPEHATPLDTVRWMLALQGQDLPGAKWSIGLREAGGTERGVEAAFDAGHIVRSWPMRGTLHVVAGEDLGWMLDLTTPAAIASSAQRRAALGLDLADAHRARDVVQRVLAGHKVLTRDATLAAIDAGGVSTAGQRGYHLLWYLAQTGTLVLGPTEGRQQTYALLDDWVPDRRTLDRDEALGELALRLFLQPRPGDGRRSRALGRPDVARRTFGHRQSAGTGWPRSSSTGPTITSTPRWRRQPRRAEPANAPTSIFCPASTSTSSATRIGPRSWR